MTPLQGTGVATVEAWRWFALFTGHAVHSPRLGVPHPQQDPTHWPGRPGFRAAADPSGLLCFGALRLPEHPLALARRCCSGRTRPPTRCPAPAVCRE